MSRTRGIRQLILTRSARRAALRSMAMLTFVSALLGASATAFAGGDEDAPRAAECRASGALERP